jgi:hypothetical protein
MLLRTFLLCLLENRAWMVNQAVIRWEIYCPNKQLLPPITLWACKVKYHKTRKIKLSIWAFTWTVLLLWVGFKVVSLFQFYYKESIHFSHNIKRRSKARNTPWHLPHLFGLTAKYMMLIYTILSIHARISCDTSEQSTENQLQSDIQWSQKLKCEDG